MQDKNLLTDVFIAGSKKHLFNMLRQDTENVETCTSTNYISLYLTGIRTRKSVTEL